MSDENPYVVGPSPYDGERLRKLYHGEGLTVDEVAERLDRSPGTVSSWMDDFGIERRSGGSDPRDEWVR
jgi:transposase-like protein